MATVQLVARNARRAPDGLTVDDDMLDPSEHQSVWVTNVATAAQALEAYAAALIAKGRGERPGNGLFVRACWPANAREPRGWKEAVRDGLLARFFAFPGAVGDSGDNA